MVINLYKVDAGNWAKSGARVRCEPLFVGCLLCSVEWCRARPSVLSAPFIPVHRLGQGGQPLKWPFTGLSLVSHHQVQSQHNFEVRT